MSDFKDYFCFLDKESSLMAETLTRWSEINSYSYNIGGLDQMRVEIIQEFQNRFKNIEIEVLELEPELSINDQGQEEKKSLAKSLRITKKSGKKKILLMGHMDTVFPEDSSFQKTQILEEGILNGPGVADLKGGIVVMIKALETLERSPYADEIAWQVFLNSDEEIGSPGSQKIFPELAERNELALVYEPSLSDGSIAYRRKGVGNFTLIVNGKAAHVGREFNQGASAILASAEFITKAQALNSDDVILNFGRIQGGGPLNVVPDLAVLKMNARIQNSADGDQLIADLEKLVAEMNQAENINAELDASFNRQPKVPNAQLEKLFKAVQQCGVELGQEIKARDTGGCCDGNNLYELGLVNIDTMGVRGGAIHSDKEYVILDSLVERAKLSALFLMKYAAGEIEL